MSDHSPTPDATPPLPVTPRPAASLLVLREGAAGTEALMGMRGAGHRFMPNRLVFPGGAVDPEDHAAPAASELLPHVLSRLTRGVEPSLARALAIAAARELFEETALSLGDPPALDGLDYLCRAITPPTAPMRFDAHFFVVPVGRVAGDIAGSGELEGLRYYGVAEAMALDLTLATKGVFERLLEWLAMSADQRAARERVPVLRERKWREEDE
jgi:8-oxo-dGTP pyrophosphatase MutT (NUDIX family)